MRVTWESRQQCEFSHFLHKMLDPRRNRTNCLSQCFLMPHWLSRLCVILRTVNLRRRAQPPLHICTVLHSRVSQVPGSECWARRGCKPRGVSDAVAASAFREAQHCSVQTLTLHPKRRCPPYTEKQPEIHSILGILLTDPAPRTGSLGCDKCAGRGWEGWEYAMNGGRVCPVRPPLWSEL